MCHVGNASGAAGGVGDAASVQNLSTLLLQPIIEPRDVVHQLLHALDLYYTPGVIGVGEQGQGQGQEQGQGQGQATRSILIAP